MADSTIDVLIQLKKDAAEQDLAAFTQNVLGQIGQLSAGQVAAIGGLVGTAVAAWGQIAHFVSEGSRLAREQEFAEARLASALKNRGDITGETTKRMLEMNAELAKTTLNSATELASLERSLAMHGVQNQSLAEGTRLAIGLSKITGEDLASSTVIVSKLLEGNVNVLHRMGLAYTDTTEAIEKLDEAFRESSGAADTQMGTTKRLSHDLEELTKAIFTNKANPEESQYVKILKSMDAGVRQLTDDIEKDGLLVSFLGLLAGASVGENAQWESQSKAIADRKKGLADLRMADDANLREQLRQKEERENAEWDAFAAKVDTDTKEKIKKANEAAKALYKKMVENPDEYLSTGALDLLMHGDVDSLKDQGKALFEVQQAIEAQELGLQKQNRALALAQEKSANEGMFDLKLAAFDREKALEDQINEERFNKQVEDYDRRQALTHRFFEAEVAGMADGLSEIVSGAVQGQAEMDKAFDGFGLNMLRIMGQFLVQAGEAGLAASELVKFFAIPVVGEIAAIAAIGLGATLIGLSDGARANLAKTSASSRSSPGAGALPPSIRSPSASGGFGGSSGAAGTIINNFNFGPGFLVGTPRQLGRQIGDLLKKAGTLQFG